MLVLTKTRLPAPEELLLDYARRLDRHRQGRRALWIHLSRLSRHHRRDGDHLVGGKVMRPLARKYQGEVFSLASGDVVVLLKDPDEKAIDSALFELRLAFSHDPLMRRADEEGPEVYLTVYDIAATYDAFLDVVKLACTRRGPQSHEPQANEPQAHDAAPGARLIFSREQLREKAPATLPGHIDTSQGRIAVERLLERQTIGRVVSPHMTRPWGKREAIRPQALDAFDHLNVAVSRHQVTASSALSEVERLLMGGWCDLLRSEGTERTLLMLRTETLMSAEFLTFDRWIMENGLAHPSISLYLEDALSDAETVAYLRGFLRERKYRIGLGAVPLGNLALVRDALSGMAFLEIAIPPEIQTRDKELLSRIAGEWGEETVLAAAVASPQVLEAVFEAGIRYASGPAVRA